MTQPQTIRFLILGLPAGLIITGVIAMFIYFRLEDKEKARSGHVQVRRAVSAEDLEAHVTTLAGRIGERNDGAPQGLAGARKYIQSTLGPANLGFRVSRQDFTEGETEYYNLIIDLPGTDEKRREEVILVGANYDSAPGTPGAIDNASGIAALMSLAETFAGTANARPLRLVAFANDAAPRAGTDRSGSAAYAKLIKKHGEKVVMMFSLERMARARAAAGAAGAPEKPTAKIAPPVLEPAPAAAALLTKWLDTIRPKLDVPAPAPLPAAAPAGACAVFTAEGYPAVRVTDAADPLAGGPADTADRVDYAALAAGVRGMEEILKEALNPAPDGMK